MSVIVLSCAKLPSSIPPPSDEERAALKQYVGELVRRYPGIEGQYHINPWLGHEHTYLVSILPP